MAEKYDHKAIEQKWQKKWEETQAFRAADDSSKPKTYILDMFPYPSGDGLHVGHVEGYTATDIYSRYKRMCGFEVLHPIGWDAFGLPAENFAIKTGVPPQETTDKSIGNFRKQIKSLGLSYDWSRELGTHTPEYYKWTQWFFLFLYKNGLAEKKMAKVNWCSKDQTVLANEQTVSESGEKGVCVRCGTKVVQKDLSQWFFKITDFADALVDDLDTVDWPESTKTNQRNWIGRSEGAQITFQIANSKSQIEIFTTRPDTLFGATYMVLAPEHSLVEEMSASISNKNEVFAYVAQAKNKTDLDRQEEAKDKTGVELKGIRAINPANQEEIPVYIADYVLWGYGTGAIMAVPAHDERDFAFAKKFDIPIKQVIQGSAELPFVELGILINSGRFDGVKSEEAKKKITDFVDGKMVKTYRLRDWLISRQRYWGAPIPMVYDPEGKAHPVPEEHLPWTLPTDVEFKPHGTSPLGESKELLERTERIFGTGWKPEVDTMDTFVCSSWYYFRFADPHNTEAFALKEKVGEWLPVDLYMGGAEHTVLHLMYARFFTKALQRHGVIAFGEPFSKLRHQGMVLAENGGKMSKSKGNVINPDDVIRDYGADTLRLYEMFMGPLEAMKPWSTKSIVGSRRFLDRVWKLKVGAENVEAGLETLVQQTIQKVGNDVDALKMNTAVSALMILLNEFEKLSAVPSEAYKNFVHLLSPFAPHLSNELAEREGFEIGTWPSVDESKLMSAATTIAVQVNGKVRGTVELPVNASEGEVLAAAKANPHVAKWVAGEPKKLVYVPGRVLNIITPDA